MPVFKSEKKGILASLQKLEPGDRAGAAALLVQLKASNELGFDDALQLLRMSDSGLRDHGLKLIKAQADEKTVERIVNSFKASTEAQRRQIIGFINQMNLPGATESFLAILENTKDEPATRFAVDALLSTTLANRTIRKLQDHTDAGVRTRLVAKLGEQKQVQRLLEMLADDSERVRNAATQAVSPLLTVEDVPLLIERLTEDVESGRVFAATLERLSNESGMAVATQVIPLLANDDAAVRAIALQILQQVRDVDALFKGILAHAKLLSGWVKERLIDSMKAFGPRFVEPILALMDSDDVETRATCLALVLQFKDKRVVPQLIKLLKDPDWWIKIAAIDALGALKEEAAISELILLLDDDDVRWQAIEAVLDIGQPAGFQAVVNLLRDPDPTNRTELLRAVRRFPATGALGDKLVEIVKRFAERDPDDGVREAALTTYVDMAKSMNKAVDPKLASAAEMLAVNERTPKMHAMLAKSRERGASDCHLSVNQPIMFRVDGELTKGEGDRIDAEGTKALIMELLSPEQRALLDKNRQLDLCLDLGKGGRYRTSIYLDQQGYNAAFHVIPASVPTFTGIGLPPHLMVLSKMHQGLVVVSGSAGTGKSTTLAAFVNLINDTRFSHVLTMEDPIEFVHTCKSSLINQREIPVHSESFARALRGALREDPDVIVVGEMRDAETMGLALSASETGHIVFGTLNTTTAPKTVDRIISSFGADEQPQVRAQLSESLKAVICQKLIPKIGGGRVAVFEVLMGTLSLANLIRDNKTYQIPSLMQVGRAAGNIPFDDALAKLLEAKEIAPEWAYRAAEAKARFEPLLSPESLAALKN